MPTPREGGATLVDSIEGVSACLLDHVVEKRVRGRQAVPNVRSRTRVVADERAEIHAAEFTRSAAKLPALDSSKPADARIHVGSRAACPIR